MIEKYLQKVLRSTSNDIEEELEPLDIINDLCENGVLSKREKDNFDPNTPREERVEFLLKSLYKKNSTAFESFVNALEKCGVYDTLAETLKEKEKLFKQHLEKDALQIFDAFREDDSFLYKDILFTVGENLTKHDVFSLCSEFSVPSEMTKRIRKSDNPGLHMIAYLYSKEKVKLLSPQREEIFLEEIHSKKADLGIPQFIHILRSPGVPHKGTLSSFLKARSINRFSQDTYGVYFKDYSTESSVISFKVPSMKTLNRLYKDINNKEIVQLLLEFFIEEKGFTDSQSFRLQIDENSYIAAKEKLSQKDLESSVSQHDFEKYLSKYGLQDKYPNKLSMKVVNTIKLLKDRKNHNAKDIPFIFLYSLTALDSSIVLPERLQVNDSVRDFICALMHCSDDFLRQHMVERMSSCQLAIPLIIPMPVRGRPMFVPGALQRVVKKWLQKDTLITTERDIVSEPLYTVAFLRIGDIPVSKSLILNNMFGRAQNNPPAVYFLSQREDHEKDSTFSKGTLEAHWYIPQNQKDGDILKEVTTFLNLRGDSKSFPIQTEVASRVADLVIAFVEKSNESEINVDLQEIKSLSSKLIVVVVSGEQQFMSIKKPKVENDRVECGSGSEDIHLCKTLCNIITNECAKLKKYKGINQWSGICKNFGINVTVDEESPVWTKAKNSLDTAFGNIDKLTIGHIKDSCFGLQKLWLKWVQTDQKRIKQDLKFSAAAQDDIIRREKKKIRELQHSQGLSQKMQMFLSVLQDITLKNKGNLHYFMIYFQSQINKLVQIELPQHVVTIKQLEEKIKKMKLCLHGERNDSDKNIIKNQIAQLSKDVNSEMEKYKSKHIGFEYFMRELGQYFEGSLFHEKADQAKIQLVAATAARLLIEGYPLELLEGESIYMPIDWVTSVLNIVQKILEDPKIFVLSVIGVQSSGKSTLLNCMFGVRFAVRAGRCTRGMFLQMLTVDSKTEMTLGFKYVLIIDTEGLQSPDRNAQRTHRFDNSLATFAMCVVDLSILNIAQETMGPDMIGILQIAAHALIRMKRVQLVSQFRIIHQRVSDVTAADENKLSARTIKEQLNKAARAAAEAENVNFVVKEFSDLFAFSEDDHFYIPSLWMGNMSPPNTAYSDSIFKLKKQILMSLKNKPQFTLSKFIKRLEDVWYALKKEDFVFNFQNSFNALSYNRFCLAHNSWIGAMRTNMVKWELKNKDHVEDYEQLAYFSNLEKEIQIQIDKAHGKIDIYVKNHPEDDEVHKQEYNFKKQIKNIAEEISHNIKNKFNYIVQSKKEKAAFSSFLKDWKIKLRRKAKEKTDCLRVENPNIESNKKFLEKTFEDFWKTETGKLQEMYKKTKLSEISIKLACEVSLQRILDRTQYNKRFLEIVSEQGGIVEGVTLPQDVHSNVLTANLTKFSHWLSSVWDRMQKGESAKGKVSKKDSILRNNVTQIANRKLREFRDENQFEAYGENIINTYLTDLFKSLREHIQTSEEFVLHTMLHFTRAIATISMEKQQQFENKYSLEQVIQEEKKHLKQDFFTFFDDTLQTERAVQSVYRDILRSVFSVVVDQLNVKLLEKLRKHNCFIDKLCMIGTILHGLCDDENGVEYMDFVLHQEEYITRWLKRGTVSEACSTVNGAIWIEVEAQTQIKLFKTEIINCLKITKEQLDYNGSQLKDTNISQATSISLTKWQEIFVANWKGIKINPKVGEMIFKSIYHVPFTKKLISIIETSLKTDVENHLELNQRENISLAKFLIDKMNISPHSELMTQIKGCTQVCPFCKVGCHLQNAHTQHRAVLHYPQGLTGFKDFQSQEIILDICTLLVASDYNYRFNESEDWKPYKKYAEEFPNWDITPAVKEQSTIHWQWVMANFCSLIVQKHGAKMPKIPLSWKEISKSAALSSLVDFYHLDTNAIYKIRPEI